MTQGPDLGWEPGARRIGELADLETPHSQAGPFLIPADICVMHGVGRYDERHPFLRALRSGPDELRQFYRRRQPRDLAEMYDLPKQGRAGEDQPPWRLPWVRTMSAPTGEHGLGPEHGVSYFGPCSQEKVALEHRRLTTTYRSIRNRGYRPERDIVGHFLERNGQLRFFVRGGKHRTAALVALGYEAIRVDLRRGWPLLVRRDQARSWPWVRSGVIDPGLALAVFDRYFER